MTATDTDTILFCEQLLSIRKARNLTGSDMARRLDISPALYHRYEKDIVPPLRTLKKIADILEVTIDELAGRTVPSDLSVQSNLFIRISRDYGCILKVGQYKVLTHLTKTETERLLYRANRHMKKVFATAEDEFFRTTLLGYCVSQGMRILDERNSDYYKL